LLDYIHPQQNPHFVTYLRECKKLVAYVDIPLLLDPDVVLDTKYNENSTKECHKRVTEFNSIGPVV
jgi:hypothetical protein